MGCGIRLTSASGQTLPKWVVLATSAFPSKATELRTLRDVSNVPIRDSCTAALPGLFYHLVGNMPGCESIRVPSRSSKTEQIEDDIVKHKLQGADRGDKLI